MYQGVVKERKLRYLNQLKLQKILSDELMCIGTIISVLHYTSVVVASFEKLRKFLVVRMKINMKYWCQKLEKTVNSLIYL